MPASLPGLPKHQQILQTILDFYATDVRIRAIVLFGSLGRGTWDSYSDLDLDIVTNDDSFSVPVEFKRLCDYIKQKYGLESIIIADEEEGDVVLSNLVEFSIRYHPLATTKPAILATMHLLTGDLSPDQIRVAGEANQKSARIDISVMISQCVRYCLEVRNAISRGKLWMALELLHRIRGLLMQIFTVTHGGERAIQFFEAQAGAELQERLMRMVPTAEPAAITAALDEAVHLLLHDLATLSDGQYPLSPEQRMILQAITEQE